MEGKTKDGRGLHSKANHTAMRTSDLLEEMQQRVASLEETADEVTALREKIRKQEQSRRETVALLTKLQETLTHPASESESLLLKAINLLSESCDKPADKDVSQSSLNETLKSSSGAPVTFTTKPFAPTDTKLHFTMFLGSVRDNRNSDRVKKYLLHTLETLGIAVTVFDPLEYDYHQLIQPLHYYHNQQEAPQLLRDLNDIVRKADGHIIVTPEYHASMGPSLATLIGQFAPFSFAYRPAAIISYSKGRYGGIRAAMQLRTYLSELALIHVPCIVAIPHVEQEITADGKTANPDILTPTAKVMEELIWFATAIKNHAKDHDLLYRGKLWSDHGPNRNVPSKE